MKGHRSASSTQTPAGVSSNTDADWLLQVWPRPLEQDRRTRLETNAGYLDNAIRGQSEAHTDDEDDVVWMKMMRIVMMCFRF